MLLQALHEGFMHGLQLIALMALHQQLEVVGEEQLAQVRPGLATDRMHGSIQHIQVDGRQARLDGFQLLLAHLADGGRGLRRNGHHGIALVAHAHQNILGCTLAITERYVPAGIVHAHHGLAVLAQRLAGIPFEQDLHDRITHW
ncbi:hypothetical protein D3C76_1026000 [compost metagenome]